MGIKESFTLAMKNILSSKMRSFLTMLGIVIGVSAVFVIAGMGNGMKTYVKSSFTDMGTNTLNVNIYYYSDSVPDKVDIDDLYALIQENKDYYQGITPEVYTGGYIKYGKEKSETTNVKGVSEDYMELKNRKISQGRDISYVDVINEAQVCVIGSYLANKWFAGSPVGEEITIAGVPFTIIGVAEQIDENTPRPRSEDDTVLMPYTASAIISGNRDVSSYTIMTNPDEAPETCRVMIEDFLRGEMDTRQGDFYVNSMAEMLKEMDQMINIVSLILGVIAAISLVVGGIGIMNIMLVSVTERTREIGIRKALGAKERYIMQQFVIEAGVTSGLGGLIGIGFGYILAFIATFLIKSMANQEITVLPGLGAVLIAFGVSVFIGILFGYLPAKKASRLNPIDALRFT